MSRHMQRRGPSVLATIRKMLAGRVQRVDDPTAGAPKVDYKNNPWVSYADLEDVFTPPPLDADGNPIREVVQKEWREDPRSLKGWTDVNSQVPSAETDPDQEFKL